MKKLLCLLLCAAMAAGLLPFSAAAAEGKPEAVPAAAPIKAQPYERVYRAGTARADSGSGVVFQPYSFVIHGDNRVSAEVSVPLSRARGTDSQETGSRGNSDALKIEVQKEYVYPSNVTIGFITASANGNITYEVSDQDNAIVASGGRNIGESFQLTSPTPGNYTVQAKLNSADEYNGAEANATFTVHKATSTIVIDVNEVYLYEDTVIVNLTTTGSGGRVTVNLQGEYYSDGPVEVTDDKQYIKTAPDLRPGHYNITATLEEDDYYSGAVNSTMFRVKLDSLLVEPKTICYDQLKGAVLTTYTPSSVAGNVTLTIRGNDSTLYEKTGEVHENRTLAFRTPIDGWLPGEYKIIADSTGGQIYETYYDPATYETSFTITPAVLNATAAQSGSLAYTGSPQSAEVNAEPGTRNGQKVAFTYSAEKDGTYTDTVPAFTEPGNYTVYYKATAPGHYDESGEFPVKISKASVTVTARDQSIKEDEDIATGPEQAELAGAPEGFTLGAVELAKDDQNGKVVPSGAVILDRDGKDDTANFDITYQPGNLDVSGKISATVTFRVMNGSWNDGTDGEKTVTLKGYAGDVLKLSESDIPAAGSKPAEGYKEGSWDTVPSAGTAVTADTTYTYTYEKKEQEPEPAKTEYTVIWQNGDGTELDKKTYKEGEAEPTTDKVPTKEEDEDNTYAFDKWDSGTVSGTVKTYKPAFTATAKEKADPAKTKYTVIWLNGDGRELDKKTYKEGEAEPTTDKVPTKAEDANNTYTFDKWDGGTVNGNEKTYKPLFTAVAKPAAPKPAEPNWWYAPEKPPAGQPGRVSRVTVGDGIYELDEKTGTAKLVGITSEKIKELEIPATVSANGRTYKVTEIDREVCQKLKKLKKVTFGKYVRIIGDKAFYKAGKLRTLIFKGKKLKSVGAKAFWGIHKKAKATVPGGKFSLYKKLLLDAGFPEKGKIGK